MKLLDVKRSANKASTGSKPGIQNGARGESEKSKSPKTPKKKGRRNTKQPASRPDNLNENIEAGNESNSEAVQGEKNIKNSASSEKNDPVTSKKGQYISSAKKLDEEKRDRDHCNMKTGGENTEAANNTNNEAVHSEKNRTASSSQKQDHVSPNKASNNLNINTLDSDAVQSKKKKSTSPSTPESEKNSGTVKKVPGEISESVIDISNEIPEKTLTEVKLSVDVTGINLEAYKEDNQTSSKGHEKSSYSPSQPEAVLERNKSEENSVRDEKLAVASTESVIANSPFRRGKSEPEALSDKNKDKENTVTVESVTATSNEIPEKTLSEVLLSPKTPNCNLHQIDAAIDSEVGEAVVNDTSSKGHEKFSNSPVRKGQSEPEALLERNKCEEVERERSESVIDTSNEIPEKTLSEVLLSPDNAAIDSEVSEAVVNDTSSKGHEKSSNSPLRKGQSEPESLLGTNKCEEVERERSQSVIATSKAGSNMQQGDIPATHEQYGIEVSSETPSQNVTLNRDDVLELWNSATGLKVGATEVPTSGNHFNMSADFSSDDDIALSKYPLDEARSGTNKCEEAERLAGERSESVIITSKPASHLQQGDIPAPHEQNSNSKLQNGIQVSSESPNQNVTLNGDGSAMLHCDEFISDSDDYEKEGRPQGYDVLGLGNGSPGSKVVATEVTTSVNHCNMSANFSSDDDEALSQYPLDEIVNQLPLDEIVNRLGTSEEEKEQTQISFEEYRLTNAKELLSNSININIQESTAVVSEDLANKISLPSAMSNRERRGNTDGASFSDTTATSRSSSSKSEDYEKNESESSDDMVLSKRNSKKKKLSKRVKKKD